MMRLAYALAWLVAAPLVLVRLAWRSRRQPGYLAHLAERFGGGPPAPDVPRIWVHAVSVGETRAAAPLVAALARRHPRHRILVTHMTPTGRAAGGELFGDTVERAWLPYDLGFAIRRFLARYRPEFGILLETEIWPRLLEECARAGIPVALANARLSERSARRYARVAVAHRLGARRTSRALPRRPRPTRARFAALGAREVDRHRQREVRPRGARRDGRARRAISARASASTARCGWRAARARARRRCCWTRSPGWMRPRRCS